VNDVTNTVTDSTTALVWQRNAKYVNPGYINYANAVATCSAKGAGWRLPTASEVSAIRPGGCDFPDESAFPGMTYNYIGLWSSTAGGPVGQHVVALNNSYDFDTNLHNVMCVK
jgi:hypothetical protein